MTTSISGSTGIDKVQDGTIVSADLDSGLALGKVLQVVSATKADTFSTTSTSFTDITGLSASITPSSTSSKILVLVSTNASNTTVRESMAMRMMRDSTAIYIGDSGTQVSARLRKETTNATANISMNHLDSPSSTSSLTYKVQILTDVGNNCRINYEGGGSSNRYASSITLMEIGA
jgi:type IV secretory pathway VirJ component